MEEKIIQFLKKLNKEKQVTFQQIQTLYGNKLIKEIDFESKDNTLYLKRVLLRNGRELLCN